MTLKFFADAIVIFELNFTFAAITNGMKNDISRIDDINEKCKCGLNPPNMIPRFI